MILLVVIGLPVAIGWLVARVLRPAGAIAETSCAAFAALICAALLVFPAYQADGITAAPAGALMPVWLVFSLILAAFGVAFARRPRG